jgi:hypothetical protein
LKPIVAIWSFALLFLALAAGAFVIGVHDTMVAGESFGVAAGGVVLLAAAVVLAIAGLDLARLTQRGKWEEDGHPPCRPIVLVGFLLVILLGVYVFLSTIRSDSAQRPVVAVFAALLIAGALLGLAFFGRDARVTLPRIGTIALGFLGTAIGVWQFWYSSQYAPSHAGRAVVLNVALEKTGEQGPNDVIRATIDYEDVTGTSVAVVGSTYTLTGSRVVRCPRPAAARSVSQVFSGFLTDPQRTRFMADAWELQPAAVLAAGKFVGDGKRLEQKVSAGRTLVFYVPRGPYQLLRFRAQLFAIPASVQLSQRSLPDYVRYPDDNDLYGFWHVDDDSWLRDLVYGRDRWVVIRYELVSRPLSPTISPDLRVTARFPRPTWIGGVPSEERVHDLFSKPESSVSSEPFADTELAVAPVAEAEARDRSSVPRSCR